VDRWARGAGEKERAAERAKSLPAIVLDERAMEAVVGDVAGAAIAFAAIVTLRTSVPRGVVLSWLLVVETILDVVVGVYRKLREPLWGIASGVNWLILDFYIPLILVSLVLIVWQLSARSS